MQRTSKLQCWRWCVLLLTVGVNGLWSGLLGHAQIGPTATPTNTPIQVATPTPTNTPVVIVTPTPTNTAINVPTPTPNPLWPYWIARWQFVSNRGRSQGGSYQVHGSAGLAVLGRAMSSGFQLYSGYWIEQSTPALAFTPTSTNTGVPGITPVAPTHTPTAVPQATPTPSASAANSVFLPLVTK